MSDPNRRVHAHLGSTEVVRYERAGKWYIESDARRTEVSIKEAAEEALLLHSEGGTIILGLPGGATFDRLVREKR